MGVEERFHRVVASSLRGLVAEGALPAEVLAASFVVEKPKRDGHGDLATNAALALAKTAKKNPRDVATLLKDKLAAHPETASVELAGPGFLNVKLAPSAFHAVLGEVLTTDAYGHGFGGRGQRVMLEFVSANPTGPLLISHARGAVVGDALARLLEATGAHVHREYYVNDFGNQVRLFARSVLASAFAEPLPEGGYPGAYVDAVARYLRAEHGALLDAAHGAPADEVLLAQLARECVARMLDGVPGDADLPGIRSTLRSLGVAFDAFYSEESLHRWGRVGAALARLARTGFIHTLQDGAWVFKMPEGAGEADEEYAGDDPKKQATGGRVVRKNDGHTFTYFASDIAYHADKVDRGYDRLITVLGADHHGYVPRIRNVLTALGLPTDRFEAPLFQLVSLVRDGKPYKMGKRLGNLITADEVMEEIDEALGAGAGKDAIRYFYLSRRMEIPVELDVELAKRASLDNPAIYLQYGHARLASILRRAKADLGLEPPEFDATLAAKLVHPGELAVLQHLGTYPRVVREAARDLAPSRVLFFVQELAELFQGYYTQTKQAKDPILPMASARAVAGWEASWDRPKTEARLAWIEAIRRVYRDALGLLGMTAPDEMRREARPADEGNEDAAEAEGTP